MDLLSFECSINLALRNKIYWLFNTIQLLNVWKFSNVKLDQTSCLTASNSVLSYLPS